MTVTATPGQDTSYSVPNATTATKTDTPIMETPVNIQVIPQQVLRDQQAFRIGKALENVSGVSREGRFGGENFNVRGFEVINIYRDGVPVDSGNFGIDRETANLERIEVLKGPAAILYGADEPGGIINVVTKQPLAETYYALEQQVGSFDFYRTTIDASGPFTQDDSLLYRFNLAYENAGSFEEFAERERIFLAPVLRWNLSEQTQVNFELEYVHESSSAADQFLFLLGEKPLPIPRERNLREPGTDFIWDEVRVGFNWSHAFNHRWTLRHYFTADLTSVDIPLNVGLADIADPSSCTPESCLILRLAVDAPGGLQQQHYYTSLNLTGKVDTWALGHTLLLGAEYQHRHQDDSFGTRFKPFTPIDAFHPVHTGGPPAGFLDDAEVEFGGPGTTGYTQAAYLQDQIKLPYDIHLLGGFRYDRLVTLFHGDDDEPEDAVTPRVGILWRAIPALSLYTSYTENFGGGNGRTADGSRLPPQAAQQWEVGLKTELWDGRFTGTLSWYDLTKQNITIPDPNIELARQGFVRAIGEVGHRGVELDLAGELLPGWNVIGSYTFIDSEITKDSALDENGNLTPGNTGKRLFGVPEHGGSLWRTYEIQQVDWRGLKFGAGFVARGPAPVDNANTFDLPGFVTVNLMSSYRRKIGPSKVTFQLNVDNLLDKEQLLAEPFGGSAGFVGLGTPRTFLGSVRVEF